MTSVVFRCDAGPGIGGGHVTRCLALAHAVTERGHSPRFLVRPGTLAAVPLLARCGFAVSEITVPEDEEAAEMSALVGGHAGLLIFDGYRFDCTIESRCRAWATGIAAFDDEPGMRKHDVDVLIDMAPTDETKLWSASVPLRCIVASGAAYAALRPEIVRFRQVSLSRRRRSGGTVERILVSFGMSDSRNATALGIVAARSAFPESEIVAAIGPSAAHRRAVETVGTEYNAEVLVDPPDLVERLTGADIALGAGGVSALERACLGLPSFIIDLAPNQSRMTSGMVRAGAAASLGALETLGADDVAAALASAASVEGELLRMTEAAAALVDGNGAGRLARLLDDAIPDPGQIRA
jgi:UDP-2,4-diacetamido-2,4,6-trideoxy-beta-L-altropyranose hydrolase